MEKQVMELLKKTNELQGNAFYEIAVDDQGNLFYDVPINDVDAYDMTIEQHRSDWLYVGRVYREDTAEDVISMIAEAKAEAETESGK